MRYYELTELFDSTLSWKWVARKPDYWGATFSNNDANFNVHFSNDDTKWEMLFSSDSSYELTGKGDAYAVFSTLLTIASEFINQTKPNVLELHSNNKIANQVSLFSKLANMLANKINYQVTKQEVGPETRFVLKSKTINESFDSAYNWIWDKRTDTSYNGHFEHAGERIDVDMSGPGDTWEIYFSVLDSFEATDSGNANKVFSTVGRMILEMVAEEKPLNFYFTSSKERDRLYKKLAATLAERTGYKLVRTESRNQVSYDYKRTEK